jgi:quercetin dioxygenase-like cupin family protein
MGSLFEHLVTAEQTGGTLGMSVVTQPPGIATPLHRHTREAEALFVLEGVIEDRAGDESYEPTTGSFLHLPLAVPHAFRIHGTAPARFVSLTAPAA